MIVFKLVLTEHQSFFTFLFVEGLKKNNFSYEVLKVNFSILHHSSISLTLSAPLSSFSSSQSVGRGPLVGCEGPAGGPLEVVKNK